MLDGCVPWPDDFVIDYQRKGYWSGETAAALPGEWARRSGEQVAVISGQHRSTYREFDIRTSELAVGFQRLGITPGDRVVVQLPNVAEFLEVLFGLFKAGAVPVVVLPAYRRSEVTYFCNVSEAVAYVIADEHAGFHFLAMAEDVKRDVASVRDVVIVGPRVPSTVWTRCESTPPVHGVR